MRKTYEHHFKEMSEMSDQGMTQAQIGKKFGCTGPAVSQIFKRNGKVVVYYPNGLLDHIETETLKGRSVRDIEKSLNDLFPETVQKWKSPYHSIQQIIYNNDFVRFKF